MSMPPSLHLRHWINRYVLQPVIVLSVLLLFSQSIFIFSQSRHTIARQTESMEQFRSFVRSTTSPNHIGILNQLAAHMIGEYGGGQILYCTDYYEVAWSFPLNSQECRLPQKFFERTQVVSVFDDQGYPKIIFSLPYFSQPYLFLTAVLISFLVVGMNLFLMGRIRFAIFGSLLPQIKSLGKKGALKPAIHELNETHQSLLEYQEKENEFAANLSRVHLSQQVAHDIKSPLAALSVLQQDLAELPEEKRLLLRSAVQRIHDIANDLSKKKNLTDDQNASDHPSQQGHEELSVQLLSSLIDTLVSEKRLQFRSKINVEIEASLGQESYGLFARIQTREFKRMFSNLINNAIEAMGDNGNKVGLTLKPDETDKIKITISDNGKGIPPEILPKLMQRGETHGKSGGTGLGLYHARMTIQSWGGDVYLESEVGKGTTVTISLLQEPAPAWFVPELKIENGSTVVIVDDDNSIHQIWRGRLEKFVRECNVTLKHFSTPGEIITHPLPTNFNRDNIFPSPSLTVREGEGSADASCSPGGERGQGGELYLCDQEFLGQEKTGLDVIEELGLSKNAILVTSHFEEPKIRERCQKLGVQLIPKNLAGFVPLHAGRFTVDVGRLAQFDSPLVTDVARVSSDQMIHKDNPSDTIQAPTVQRIPSTDTSVIYGELSPSSNPHAILIDDDKLVHMNWKISAKKNGKILRTFSDPTGFQNVMIDIEKSTPIYVDSNLANGIKGEDVACELKAMGFSNLYLATGFDKSNFPDMPWIKDVVGKSPPW